MSEDCFHCGLPLPAQGAWSVRIDQTARPMCCPGCAAAAQAIVDFGLTSYYRDRSALPAQAGGAELIPPELRLLDAEDTLRRFADTDAAGTSVTLSIEGLRCAACAWLIEGRLRGEPGVNQAAMNLATERLVLRWDPARTSLSALLQAVHGIGYAAYPCDPQRQSAALQRAGKTLQRQLFVAGLAMMQVMMYAVPAYLGDGTLEADMAALLRWASLLLTVPAVFYSARPFFQGAAQALRQRALTMDVPVALGIAAAFIASLVATWRGSGEVYFDSVTMFIFLLLCSRWLELLARRNAATALERMQQGLPTAAWRLGDFPASREAEAVAPALLQIGDVVLVKPGDALPADGVIIEGATALDLSLLTGESQPQARMTGDAVPGGAINARQAILVRVQQAAQDSTLSVLLQLSQKASLSKPRLALWADQVAGWFVAALLLFAALVLGFWLWHDAARAWPIAIAVLVVSCPCALSLATPTALAAATDSLLRRGVLVVQGHTLETLRRATHVIFDKTGTLTEGLPGLQRIDPIKGTAAESLAIAAALEAGNAHPLAAALVAAARAPAASLSPRLADDLHYTSGQGVAGTLAGQRYHLGNADFVRAIAGPVHPAFPPADPDHTPVYLGCASGWMARFALADALREDASEVVAHCQAAGKTVILLSGDQDAVVQRLAARIGIQEAWGDQLPQQKLAFVRALQARGCVVAMVGDGINDAAALSGADVSFAMGLGAAQAQAHADAILLGRRLATFSDTLGTATRSMHIIRQNLAWATLYNLLAIPAAALGLINPWVSAVGMSVSSMVVVLNAWRLRRGNA